MRSPIAASTSAGDAWPARAGVGRRDVVGLDGVEGVDRQHADARGERAALAHGRALPAAERDGDVARGRWRRSVSIRNCTASAHQEQRRRPSGTARRARRARGTPRGSRRRPATGSGAAPRRRRRRRCSTPPPTASIDELGRRRGRRGRPGRSSSDLPAGDDVDERDEPRRRVEPQHADRRPDEHERPRHDEQHDAGRAVERQHDDGRVRAGGGDEDHRVVDAAAAAAARGGRGGGGGTCR